MVLNKYTAYLKIKDAFPKKSDCFQKLLIANKFTAVNYTKKNDSKKKYCVFYINCYFNFK